MSSFKRIYINIIIFLSNFFLLNSILEIPLQPLKIKGIPKYKNISLIEPGKKIIIKNNILLQEEGDSIINNELLFLANVKIGSNSQGFNLILDTGSYLLWVARYGCSGSHKISNFFNPSTSSTCKNTGQTFQMTYGTGSCTGYYYNDNIEYIKNKKFNIYFGVAETTQFQVTGADGIIGLTKSYKDESLSFIHMLKKSGNTDSLAFSIKFENDRFTSNVKGKMYIGRHEDFSKNKTKSCPLTFYKNEMFWACTLSSLGIKGINNEYNVSYSIPVIFDTGTNSIILPKRYLQGMVSQLNKFGCYSYQQSTSYTIICDASKDVPDFHLEFNGKIFIIPKQYGFYYASGDKKYVASIIIFNDSTYPIIGSLFFFLFHTLFDEENKQLKFYPLKNEIIEKQGADEKDKTDEGNKGNEGNKRSEGNKKNKEGLPTYLIIIIAVSSVGVVLLLIFIVYNCIKNGKPKSNINPIGQDYNAPLYPNTS